MKHVVVKEVYLISKLRLKGFYCVDIYFLIN